MSSRPRIVILGAGFGGMYVAKKLAKLATQKKIDLTIINRTNYFLFTPLLHEVATGGLNPRSVAEPIREVFRGTGVRVIQGIIDKANPERKIVTVNGEVDACEIPYDYLVVATGAETNYYGIPGADTSTLPLKTLSDAAVIRSKIIDVFEKAILAKNVEERRRLLSFAVVGGGATGVELAAELAELVSGMVKRYYSGDNCIGDDSGTCSPDDISITLIHMGKELLEMFAPPLRKAAAKRLMKNGVKLRLETAVKNVDRNGLTLSDGSRLESETVIWAAGVKSVIPSFIGGEPATAGGRLIVDEYFRLQNMPNVFALGDAAGYVDVHEFAKDSKNTRPIPMLAQVAVAESKTVAANLIASMNGSGLTNFHYHSKGSMVSVGQWFAIGEIFSMNIAGRLTWWIWRTVYLFKFASSQKRVRIAIDWTLDMFFPRDITKLM